jgi:glycosyltransferase involved in cell wall biosynthesis
MRIAFLCKRRYMSKDVIVDRYARLYEIPRQLALLGHDVLGLCLSYYPSKRVDRVDDQADGRLRWIAPVTGKFRILTVIPYPWQVLRTLRGFKPDIIIGASDAPHAILARWLAQRLGTPYAMDLYDNFESFGLTRIPGMRRAFRRAVHEAAVVACTSQALADHVCTTCRPIGKVIALPSTVDFSIFHSADKIMARRALQLPESTRLIGTAGGLLAERGIGTVYEAFLDLAEKRDDVELILAGPTDPGCPPPAHPRVRHLGSITHAQVATLFQALDVGIIYLRDTPFGRYCFPQKAYEMLACGLPLAAANIGEMPHLLATSSQSLYEAENTSSLAKCIEKQFVDPQFPRVPIDDWHVFAQKLDHALRDSFHTV